MATLYVGSDQTYKELQAAINAASDGDTIIIATGDYTAEGEIQINKALTVKAAEDAEVIVDHVVLGSSFNDPAVSAVTVSGLTIKPTAHNGGDWHYTGVWQNNINISAITIENCVIDFSNTPDDVASVGIKLSRGDVGDAVETLEITGNTIIGTDKTNSYITVGAKGSISSVTVEGNECYGGSSSSAVTLDFGYKTTGEVSVVVKDNAIADVTNGHGINFGNVKNSDIDITVTGNTVENVTGEGRAAINMHNTSTSVGDVTISDNTIANSTVGVDLTAIAENNTSIDVTENKITVVAGNNAFAGYTPADDANTVTVIESATSFIVDASITGNAGDIVAINGKNYIMGTNAFANLTDAVNAASATEATTITVTAGTYNEDITLDARTMEQKGDIKFVAADGADVTFSGLFTIGYYEKRVGSQKWDADVTFEGITFDQAADATHSIDIQQCNDFTMTNCKVIGDGEYGMSGTNVDNGATITGTTFENAGIQSAGSFGTNLLIDDCTFDESCVNIQSGNSVTIQNSTFDATVTDENVGDSFYCIRSNDNAIVITNTTFNIDSEVTGTAADQEKWGVLWQRNVGGRKWTATDIKVNFTDAALAQSELLFNKNGTTDAANEADRITIKGITSDADVADIIAKSEGSLVAISGSTYGFYYNGVLQDSCDLSEYLVNANITPELDKYMPDFMLGVNAFTSFTDALKNLTPYTEKITIQTALTESASADKITVALAKNLVIDGNDQTVEWNEGSNWIWFKKADGVEGDVTVSFENFNLNASAAKKSFFFGTDIAVDENSSINIWNASIQATGKVNVAAGGEFNVAKEELQIQAGGSLNVTGYEDFVAANAALADRQVFLQYSRNVYGDINVTDSYMAIFQDIRLKDNATFTADNALIQFGTGADGVWNYNPVPNGYGNLIVNGENSVFTLQNGSILEISGNVTNNGTINIDNSTFLANGTLVSDGVIAEAYNKGIVTNNGTIRVSGESTLNINSLAGEGAVSLADGATLKDSTINGGSVVLEGTATIKGANTVGTLGLGYYNHKLIIGEDASLKAAGTGRTTLSYGNTIDVDGKIAAGAAKTADKTTLTKSLDIAAGFSFTGNGSYNGQDATLSVDNAYVSFGSSTSKNSAATGNFVWNFNNSIVDFTADFQTAASTKAGLDPYFYLNVTDSVFNVGTRFAFSHENSVAVVDNSIVTITQQFKNVGSFTLQNGSTMTVGSNADGPSYEKTGNFGTLTVTGKDSVFDITAGATSAAYAFYNAETGIVNVADSAEFKTQYIKNLGEVKVDGATFNAAAGFDNQGTVEITGKSTVVGTIANGENGYVVITGDTTINDLTVTGNAIQVADGANVTDSTINTAVDLTGGTTTWSGTNTVKGVFSAGYNNYGGDLTTTITGTFNGTNFLTWGNDGITTVNIGAADAEKNHIQLQYDRYRRTDRCV